MADSHGEPNPNAAPMHHDVVENYSPVHIWIATILGLSAAVAGIVFGILLANN